jgi:hypothetical protein
MRLIPEETARKFAIDADLEAEALEADALERQHRAVHLQP